MKMWERIVKNLQQESPYDYERYIYILKSDSSLGFIRKIRAIKFVLTRIYRLGIYRGGNIPVESESEVLKRQRNLEYMNELMKFDVISFDVFDTLLIRRILEESDVFHLVGIKLQINGFRKIRKRAETEAIIRKKRVENTDEVTLYDIYSVINEWYDVDIKNGIETEMEVESAVCMANPYWSEVFVQLKKEGKKVIAISDMYLTKKEIRNLLETNGYEWDGEIFVSSECGVSKRNGYIYDLVRKSLGDEKKYIHIGDNLEYDIQMARKHGWSTIYYKNVHRVGRPYRELSKSMLVESVTGGIIDACLHNGKCSMTKLEEFGFNYFGRLNIGYCQWLNKLAKQNDIDKFFFISRDGYLLHKIYNKFFCKVSNEYVYVSRFALSQIVAGMDIELFVQQNVMPRTINNICTLEMLLQELQLEDLKGSLQEVGLKCEDVVSKYNYEKIRSFFYNQKDEVAKQYYLEYSAAEQYFKNCLKDSKKVCIVDVGWYGTCTSCMVDFLKKGIHWNGEIFGAQIGIEGGEHNIELITSGKIYSYVFSPNNNSNIYKQHDVEIGNVIAEIIFSAPEPSLQKYSIDSMGRPKLVFLKEPDGNNKIVSEVQNGVMQYAEQYYQLIESLGIELEVPAEVAYKPVLKILKNRKYINHLFGEYLVQRSAASGNDQWQRVSHIY